MIERHYDWLGSLDYEKILVDEMLRKEHSCCLDVKKICYPNPVNIDTLLRI